MRRVPLVLQTKRAECGLACLAMVLGSYDRTLTMSLMRRRFIGYGQGLTLQDVANFADQLGFASRGLRAEPPDLGRVQTPAILHWAMDHFVVLVAVKKRGCVIHDPAQGKVFSVWAEVEQKFTGVVLELWRDRLQPAQMKYSNKSSFAGLWVMIQGVSRQIVWVVVLSILLQLMVLAAPWHVQWTVDEALLSGDQHLILVLSVGFGLLLGCRALTNHLRGLLIVQLGHMLSFSLACSLLKHLLHLPLIWFEHRHLGDVVSRFTSLQPIRDLLTQGAAAVFVDVCVVVLSLILMTVYSPALAAWVLLVHLGFVVLQLGYVPRLRRLSMALVVTQATEQSHLLESVRAIHSVKVYGAESQRLSHWQVLHAATLEQSMLIQRTQLNLATLTMLVGGVELIVLMYLMAHKVLEGLFTVGMLFALLSYRGYFTERLRSLVEQAVNIFTLQVHLQRVAEIWEEPAETLQVCHTQWPDKPVLLEAKGLIFRHNDKQPDLLHNLELEIAPGEFIAIIGGSGSGKTTLLNILMGLIPPSEGVVVWGGAVLNAEACIALRNQSSCVLQNDELFSGSVLDNLVLFQPPDMSRVYRCLDDVGLAVTLRNMPMGLHTPVGDIGNTFSSGQMQRLLLARALYRTPSYLFLDEGTANLDVVSSQMIQQLLIRLNCTRIVVTHDLSFAAAADRVLLLEDGQVRPVTLAAKNAEVLSSG